MNKEGNIQVKDEIISILKKNRELYGDILIQSAIVKQNNVWKNVVTKIVPLYKNERRDLAKTLDYGDFMITEYTISANELENELERLISEEIFTIKGHKL